MPTRKAAPALAAGCTMVLKPAEQTPLTALAIAKLGEEAGLPAGRARHRHRQRRGRAGDRRAMTSSPIVRKLGFTGSTEVGKLLMAQCAAGIKKVSLELGGNAPFIVFDDADLDEAVAGALLCKFRNSGQTCISANRIYVQSPVYDEFVERLTDAVRGSRSGSGLEPDTKIGPLIERQAVDKVERHVADALERGGELLAGGEALGGLFYAADGDHRRHRRRRDGERRDVRPGRRHRPLRHRGGGGAAGERHAVRARVVLLQPRHRPHLARVGSARVRDRRHQHRAASPPRSRRSAA